MTTEKIRTFLNTCSIWCKHTWHVVIHTCLCGTPVLGHRHLTLGISCSRVPTIGSVHSISIIQVSGKEEPPMGSSHHQMHTTGLVQQQPQPP